MEEIDMKLQEEEELEGQYSEATLIKKIESSHCEEYTGPTKIDA
jgi:hypothetical protein